MFELGVLQVIGWYLASSILAAATWVTFSGQHRNPQHDRELGWFVWHWFTGGPLETTRAYSREGGPGRRIGIRAGAGLGRTLGLVGFLAAVYLQSGSPYGGGRGVLLPAVGGAVVLTAGTLGVTWAAMEWSMWRHYIQPLHWAVAADAGWPLDMRWWQVRSYIKIRRTAQGLEVFVTCGPTFRPLTDCKNKVDQIVRAKLGLKDVLTNWPDEGRHRYCEFIRQEPVPAKVPFRSVKDLIEAESTDSRVLLGLTRGGEPVWVDLDKKSPHILMSAGTGSGKTVALAGITAQLMFHDADVVVLDYKELSHIWLRDLAGVRYAREIGEIHDTALWLGEEMMRRKRAWRDITLDDMENGRAPRFKRLVIVCEEWSSTTDELRDYWTDIRASSDPRRSPAIKAMSQVLNMGRALRMNVLMVAQRAEANAVGTGAMREQFPCKILIDRFSPQTWNILASDCGPPRPGTSHAGRAQVCLGSVATEVQLMFITERQAQNWVIDKRGMQPRVPHVPHPTDMLSPGETVRDADGYGTTELDAGVPAVSLWEAAKNTGVGVVAMNYEALKKSAQRDRAKGLFPEYVDKVRKRYDPRDLQRWENERSGVIDGVDDIGGNEGDEVDRVEDIENESLAEDDSRRTRLQQESSRRDTVRARFYGYVAPPNGYGCRLWTGAVNGDGRPYFRDGDKVVLAHRFAYEDQVGPIDDGYTVDHLIGPGEPCTSFLCMEGDHLQQLTRPDHSRLEAERRRLAMNGAST